MNETTTAPAEYAATSEALCKRFGRHWALSGIDMRVPLNSFYALIGPNGAGKTTTLKMLLGLIHPSSGNATVLGRESTRLAAQDFSKIAYVAESRQLPRQLKVKQFISYCRTIYDTWDLELESKLMQLFELPPNSRIAKLSRGMRMKTALLCALAFRPQLLVMDEPFSGLDPAIREDLTHGILDLTGDHPMTVIFASHDLSEVERLADQIAYLQDGQFLFQEPLVQLMSRYRQIDIYSQEVLQLDASNQPDWLKFEQNAHHIRFIHTRYSDQQFNQELGRLISGEFRIDVTPVDLNQIFIATRKAAGAVH